jgi:hypothetical protein
MGIDCSLGEQNCQIEEKNGSIAQILTTEIHLIILKQTFGTRRFPSQINSDKDPKIWNQKHKARNSSSSSSNSNQ